MPWWMGSILTIILFGAAGIAVWLLADDAQFRFQHRLDKQAPAKKRTKTEIGDEWRKQFDVCDDLKRKIGAIDHLLEQLDAPLDGYECKRRLEAFKTPYALVHELGILGRHDPLIKWLWAEKLIPQNMMPTTPTHWGNLSDPGAEVLAEVLAEVIGRQCEYWKAQRAVLQSQHRDEAARLSALAQELGLETAPGKTSKREELKQLRVRVKEVEDEILEEEQKAATGPHRKAAGVHTDD